MEKKKTKKKHKKKEQKLSFGLALKNNVFNNLSKQIFNIDRKYYKFRNKKK